MSYSSRRRRKSRGQTLLLFALCVFLLTLVMVATADIGLVIAADQRLVGYAEGTARAGVEQAVDLSGYGLGQSGAPRLNPALAVAQARAYFVGLTLPSAYTLLGVGATTSQLTVTLRLVMSVPIWGQVVLTEQANQTPQVDV